MRNPLVWALLLLVGCLGGLTPLAALGDSEVSILKPATVGQALYRYRFDAINPAQTDTRGENKLFIYTPEFGASTQTKGPGTEAVVVDQVVTTIGTENTSIPRNGVVVSASGNAARWLERFAKPGALLQYDDAQVIIQHTPQVYFNDVDTAIRRAQLRPPANPERFNTWMNEAQTCRKRLEELANSGGLTPEFIAASHDCIRTANLAFYNTIPSVAGEFRGVWLRPGTLDPARIRQTVQTLRDLGIQNIFLETYYQGRTAHPSDVMAGYGLPMQHAQFQGNDPVRLWIDEAHQAGLKVHLWVEVFFAGNVDENPEPYGPILQKYPQWRNIQRRHINVTMPMISDVEPGHFFVDPANPEVRSFLEKLLLEMVSRYEPDGLNLDYIRYPASASATAPNYLNSTWGYTDAARKAFQAEMAQEHADAAARKAEALKKAGKLVPKMAPPDLAAWDPANLTPSSPLWPRWEAWRKNLVTDFVKDISEKARAIRPGMLVSAVVFPSINPVYSLKLQDYPRWAQEGYIQALTPIGLSTRLDLLRQQALRIKQQVPERFPVYIGNFAMYNRHSPVDMLEQIDVLHQAQMPGVMLFEWSRIRPEYEEALREGPFRNE